MAWQIIIDFFACVGVLATAGIIFLCYALNEAGKVLGPVLEGMAGAIETTVHRRYT